VAHFNWAMVIYHYGTQVLSVESHVWMTLVYHNGIYHCPIRMCHVAHPYG